MQQAGNVDVREHKVSSSAINCSQSKFDGSLVSSTTFINGLDGPA
ncbi:MAG: hypothetical protein JWS10_3447 [Cypionkella sp.]|nr:hypothetical protein [Cypionkella sp.]